VHLLFVRKAYKKHIRNSEKALNAWFTEDGPKKTERALLPLSLRECVVYAYDSLAYRRRYKLPYTLSPSPNGVMEELSSELLALLHTSSVYRSPVASPPFSASTL